MFALKIPRNIVLHTLAQSGILITESNCAPTATTAVTFPSSYAHYYCARESNTNTLIVAVKRQIGRLCFNVYVMIFKMSHQGLFR